MAPTSIASATPATACTTVQLCAAFWRGAGEAEAEAGPDLASEADVSEKASASGAGVLPMVGGGGGAVYLPPRARAPSVAYALLQVSQVLEQ